MDAADGFGLHPVRLRPIHDAERLPSMLPRLQTGTVSQPESPTTPNGPAQLRSVSQGGPRRTWQPQSSASAGVESDDANGDDSTATGDETVTGEAATEATTEEATTEPIVDLHDRMDIDDDEGVANQSAGQDSEGFNITHHSTVVDAAATARTDGSLVGFSPNETAIIKTRTHSLPILTHSTSATVLLPP